MISARTVVPARPVPDDALGPLAVTIPPDGVLLGRDATGCAVFAGLIGPAPVRVTFVGGWWGAQVLVHRLLAHGVHLAIDALATGDPGGPDALAGAADWLAVGQLAGGARVRSAGDGPLWADPEQPVVLLHDTGPVARPHSPAGPWQTSLTVLTRVVPDSHELIAGSDVVLVQRLEPREAATVAGALGLPPDFPGHAGALHHEMVAACRSRSVRYVWLTPTTVERAVFG